MILKNSGDGEEFEKEKQIGSKYIVLIYKIVKKKFKK